MHTSAPNRKMVKPMTTQTDNLTPVLTDAALLIIQADARAFKKDRKRYADYVSEMEVATEDVAYHVGLFRTEYKALYPKATADEIKAYATKVRNGLNYWTGKALTEDDESAPVNLLTAQGMAALADLDTEAQHAAITAEIERRAKN